LPKQADGNMKYLLFILTVIPSFMIEAQNDVLIIHDTSGYRMYHIFESKEFSSETQKVYMYNNFPQVIARTSYYSHGKLWGVEKTFYPSGNIYQTFVYADGKLWGEYRAYAEDGTQIIRGNFVDDKEHGQWIDGVSGCSGRYKNGKKHGRWRCNEGVVPYTLYLYKNGEVIRTKHKVSSE
jgi:antitoxin component YwqK of YwqJK toxin-antitoxin module